MRAREASTSPSAGNMLRANSPRLATRTSAPEKRSPSTYGPARRAASTRASVSARPRKGPCEAGGWVGRVGELEGPAAPGPAGVVRQPGQVAAAQRIVHDPADAGGGEPVGQ